LGQVVQLPAGWYVAGACWRRRMGPWVLRVGAPVHGLRGWMVFRDGELQGLGHSPTLAAAMEAAERTQRRLASVPPVPAARTG
jgi:hypothetical protein